MTTQPQPPARSQPYAPEQPCAPEQPYAQPRPYAQARPRPLPQPQAVLTPLSSAAIFLVVTVEDGGEEAVRELLQDLSGLVRAFGFGAPEAGLSCVAGIGSQAWDRLVDHPRPPGLHPLEELRGPRHTAVSTPGDLLFHVRAARLDLCFALAAQIMERLRGAVAVQDEVQGFRYLDARDLLGFVDGTENPIGPEAYEAVVVGAEDPDNAGGSYVVVQKYLHDLDGWNALPVEAQERIIGRTKATNIELDEETSHVSLNTVVDGDGQERDIVRDNMPFGSPGRGEFGTYFIGYARAPDVTEQMLRNMFLGTSAASHDRILDFSTAATGTLFFAPSADFLDDLPDAPGTAGAVTTGSTGTDTGAPAVSASASAPAPEPAPVPLALPEPAAPAADGSLGIGNLKRSTPT